MKFIFIFFIRLYQKFVSPCLPRRCRFYPTCSQYALEAFKKYSFFKAVFYTLYRFFRCHPFHPGGYDPLP